MEEEKDNLQNSGFQDNNPFNKVPYHIHNGADAPRVSFQNIRKSEKYLNLINVALTASQISTLFSTPVTLIGTNVGSGIIVEGVSAKITVSIGSSAWAGANNLEFRYTDGTGAKVTADMSNTFLNSSTTSYQHVAGVTTAFAPVIGVAPTGSSPATTGRVVVCVPTANPTVTGVSPYPTLNFLIKYRIISF